MVNIDKANSNIDQIISYIKVYNDVTLDDHGEWCNIYECTICEKRSKLLSYINECVSNHYKEK